MKIAFIDPFGLPYDGNTLNDRGLGGAETSVIHMARELVDLGHTVYVFNNCDTSGSYPGMYNGVTYLPIRWIESQSNYDIVIVLRSVFPFVPNKENSLKAKLSRGSPLISFSSILDTAKLKILWRHDTYCDGDELIAQYTQKGYIDKVLVLSPWHYKHTLEQLKIDPKYLVETRNGYFHYDVNTEKKDPYTFVYNAAAYKGLDNLINIWPKIIEHLPTAQLTVIGGYYKGLDDGNKEKIFSLKTNNSLSPSITIVGILKPEKVAKILGESSFFIYPCIFPETFGISTLEAQAYGAIPIVSVCGALETTAIDSMSFKLKNPTAEEFVDKVIEVTKRTDLADMRARGEILKSTSTWNAVAKEWNEKILTLKKEQTMDTPKKSILIAVPTAVRIECETFKSIYELRIPEGYRADFRFFWCYMIDQGRNQIANYAISCGYDYLLAVDSDIELPPDALEKMLAHDKDLVCGMYRMRRPEEVIEIYDTNYYLVPPEILKAANTLIEIGGCGFGCVLVKTSVLAEVGYPQFFYHQAFRFDETFSEDNDFCRKARNKGFRLYCDTTIRCRHKGTVMWEIGK